MSRKTGKKSSAKPQGGPLSALLGFVFGVVMLAAVTAGAAWVYGQHVYTRAGPETLEGSDRLVTIPRGSGVQTVAQQLVASGAIEDAFQFRMAVRFTETGPRLKAGEYAIPSGAVRSP